MSSHSLKTWATMRKTGEIRLPVTLGTKNKKSREVKIIDLEQVLEAVSFGLEVARENGGGYLIDKPGLKPRMVFFIMRFERLV